MKIESLIFPAKIHNADSKFSSTIYLYHLTSYSYGPMGFSVISSTLFRMFSRIEDAEELASTLLDPNTTFTSTADDKAFLDQTESASQLLTLHDFITSILVPYGTNLLIRKDLDVSETTARTVRFDSKNYGIYFHSETDDGHLDDILRKNLKAVLKENSKVCPLLAWRDSESISCDTHYDFC